ncbi:hypothetical protein B0H11DRAFT_2187557 [Mycena galericulata]|nr:hypothetical protein B0H11DRAFT_2187557 [Mycena galericulata]
MLAQRSGGVQQAIAAERNEGAQRVEQGNGVAQNDGIYNETIHDLLAPGAGPAKGVEIQGGGAGGEVIQGGRREEVATSLASAASRSGRRKWATHSEVAGSKEGQKAPRRAVGAMRGPLECNQRTGMRKANYAARENEPVGRVWSAESRRVTGALPDPTQRTSAGKAGNAVRRALRVALLECRAERQWGRRAYRGPGAANGRGKQAPSKHSRAAYGGSSQRASSGHGAGGDGGFLCPVIRLGAARAKGAQAAGCRQNAPKEPTRKKALAAFWSSGTAITCRRWIEVTSRKIVPSIQEARSRGVGAGGRADGRRRRRSVIITCAN